MHPTPSQLGDATLDSIFEADYEAVKKVRKVSGDSGKGEISDDAALLPKRMRDWWPTSALFPGLS